MPEIARFDGISIYIRYIRFDDHRPPHFHAIYAEHHISIAIASLEVLQGRMPRTQMHKVLNWAQDNQNELHKTWKETRPG